MTRRTYVYVTVGAGVLIALGILVLVVAPMLVCVDLPPPKHRLQLAKIKQALFAYQSDWGSFPYSASGGQSALYLLKPYLDDANVFTDPEAPGGRGPGATWNDSSGILENADYLYLNVPNIVYPGEGIPEDSQLVALLAKSGLWPGTRAFLTANGTLGTTYDVDALGWELDCERKPVRQLFAPGTGLEGR